MAAWGHALERLPDKEVGRRLCRLGRPVHSAPATYLATYDYITGRAGRVSSASKPICDEHAARFANRYGIDLASVDGPKEATTDAP